MAGTSGRTDTEPHDRTATIGATPRLVVGDRVVGECSVGCMACDTCRAGDYHRCAARTETGILNRNGGFAEYVKVPAKNCYRFANVSYSAAAFCEPLACVVFGQDRAKIDLGSEVLIIGGGPIGQLHVQASRANAASRRLKLPSPWATCNSCSSRVARA